MKKRCYKFAGVLCLLCLLSACGSLNSTSASQSQADNSITIIDPANVVFESLYAETPFTSGKLAESTAQVEENDAFGYILNYPIKKGRILSLNTKNYVFSIYKYENGSYSNEIKEASKRSFTADEDMNIAIQVSKADQSPITQDELTQLALCDTLFGMTDVVGNIHRFTVEAQTIEGGTHTTRAALFMPVTYSESGIPNKLILLSHGHSGYLADNAWYANSSDNTKLVQNYMNAGYAVFIVDNTAGAVGKASDMGCPQLVSSYFEAYDYIREHFNVEEQIYLHSRSFGTFASIRIMRERPELIKCALMTGPRVSMLKEWNDDRPDKTHVANRFGFTDPSGKTYEANKLVGYDPYTDIQSGVYPLPPTFWMLASGDMTERPTEFIAELTKLGNNVTSSTYIGMDHSGICSLNMEQAFKDALAFLSKY